MELVLPHSLRQRCVIHRARNVLAKVPIEHQAEVKKAFWALFDDTGAEPGDPAIAVVRGRAERFAAAYAKRFAAAVDCLMTDLASLTTYLRFPAGHHARIRHSNFIERPFGETRRRVKVIGRLPGERTYLGLVWAVLGGASRGWRGVVMTPAAVRQLQALRAQLQHAGHVPDPFQPQREWRRRRVHDAGSSSQGFSWSASEVRPGWSI